MWDTCPVNIQVELPTELAERVETIQKTDPEFMSKIILYGLTRRTLYQHLRNNNELADGDHTAARAPS
ncbi:MAG: hypothetical protein CME29_08535 [Gemmatimonadetes bacterium]|nr:hypothetical protein [Gemmatimonadota bacterium]